MRGSCVPRIIRRAATPLIVVLASMVVLVAPTVAQDDDRITISLNEFEDSGVSGTATLVASRDVTLVSMEISGEAVEGDHPTHIHTGTCENFDPNPTFPLTTFVLGSVNEQGWSETTVDDVSLDELLSDDHVILVHKSAEELTTYFVCGEIESTERSTSNSGASELRSAITFDDANAEGNVKVHVAHPQHEAAVKAMPSAGVGIVTDQRAGPGLLMLALGALAFGLVIGGVVLRRR